MNRRIFSGIRPSGDLHIGNYLGAIKQWLKLQDNYEVVFGIMDEHAITTPFEPAGLRQQTIETAMIYLAAGLDPAKTTLMIQSHVPAHTELAWILGTMTPLGELERMTQFKEKSGRGEKEKELRRLFDAVLNEVDTDHGGFLAHDVERFEIRVREFNEEFEEILESPNKETYAGLLNYPILMAADILLYQAARVPVGEDQKQHVELARLLAQRFNNRYGKTFTVPEVMLQKEAARIMSLTDPTKKMSKSDENESGYILLTDPPEKIRDKIKAAVTDSGKEIIYDPEKKPAISNLLVIFSEFSGEPIKDLEKRYAGKGYAEFKADAAAAVVRGLAQLQQKFRELKADESSVLKILKDGSRKAAEIANETLRVVKERIGFVMPEDHRER